MSVEFRDLGVFQNIVYTLMQEEFWQYIFVMYIGMYDLIRVLHLADQNTTAMHELHSFVL